MNATQAPDLQRTRTYTWSDPMALASVYATQSGREVIEAMSRGDIPAPPIASTLGFDGFEIDADGAVTVALIPHEIHFNPIGTVHGGVIATLMDTATGCAVHATLPQGVAYTSLDLTTRFIRPLSLNTGRVRAIGRVVHAGRRTAVAEARLVDADDRLLATASSTCIILGDK